jgi:hypothetical protein
MLNGKKDSKGFIPIQPAVNPGDDVQSVPRVNSPSPPGVSHPIPERRRLEPLHSISSHFGVYFSNQPSFGVGFSIALFWFF